MSEPVPGGVAILQSIRSERAAAFGVPPSASTEETDRLIEVHGDRIEGDAIDRENRAAQRAALEADKIGRQQAADAVPEQSLTGARPVIREATVVPIPRPRIVLAQKNEARLFALAIVRDPEYRRNLMQALRERSAPAAVENMVWAYAYGKPPDRVEVGKPGEFDEIDALEGDALLEHGKLVLGVLSGDAAALEHYASLQEQRKAQIEAETDDAAKRTLREANKRNAKRLTSAQESIPDEEVL